MTAFEQAKQQYSAIGVDVEEALNQLSHKAISIHCWQGDDVTGFDIKGSLSGGIQTTGNYIGKARTPEELMKDLDKAFSLIPGRHKLNLHANYAIFEEGEFVDRDKLEPKHFKKWVEFAKRAAKIGIENACLLDLKSGVVSGKGTSLIIDRELLSKISFIKEGEFVEKKGRPALRLIGDIEQIEPGKIVVKETTKRVVKAIESSDIVNAFLQGTRVEEPFEYLRAICSASSANYPMYFFLKQANATLEQAIKVVEATTVRGQTKQYLLSRLKGKYVSQTLIAKNGREASIRKIKYRKQWETENVQVIKEELNYCLTALLSLDEMAIKAHDTYIRSKLLELYKNFYEDAKSTVASDMRKAICRVDEVLYLF